MIERAKMKINPFLLFISLVVSGLIFYGFYSASGHHILFSTLSSAIALIGLCGTLAFSIKEAPRKTAMIKTLSGGYFWAMLLVNVLFTYFNIACSIFIITNGILLCVWALMGYFAIKAD